MPWTYAPFRPLPESIVCFPRHYLGFLPTAITPCIFAPGCQVETRKKADNLFVQVSQEVFYAFPKETV